MHCAIDLMLRQTEKQQQQRASIFCVKYLYTMILTHAEERNMLKATNEDYRSNVKSNKNVNSHSHIP